MSVRSSRIKNPTKAGECERISSASAEADLIEYVDGLPFGVMIEEVINLREHIIWRLSYLG